jgi:hypothetical protein
MAHNETDHALLRARQLFLGDATDESFDEIEELLPQLVDAGYVDIEEDRWGFTPTGRERADELEHKAG